MKNIRYYETPDFNIIIYELGAIITASTPNVDFGEGDPNGNEGWFG